MQTQLLPAHLWQTCIQGTVVKASQVCSKDPSRHIMAHFLPTSKKIILILAVGGSGHKDREDKKWPYLWSEIQRKTRDPAERFAVASRCFEKTVLMSRKAISSCFVVSGHLGKTISCVLVKRQMCTRTGISRMIRL